MRVLLAGATGTLGAPLTTQLIAAGHEVVGIGRSSSGADSIRRRGATAVTVDVLDRTALLRALEKERFDAVVHELTALKKPPLRHSDMTDTNVLRTVGSAHLLEAACATGATRLVTQSIVFGYGYRDHGTRPLTEDDPFGSPQGDALDPHVAAMLSAEQQALSAPDIEGVALRYGILYGADLDSLAAMLRRRMVPVVRGGGEIPFVHHDDAAAATVAALEHGRSGTAYNIVDDSPATFRDLIEGVAAARATSKPLVVPTWMLGLAAPYARAIFGTVSMRVANTRAREQLGWPSRFPSTVEGIAAA